MSEQHVFRVSLATGGIEHLGRLDRETEGVYWYWRKHRYGAPPSRPNKIMRRAENVVCVPTDNPDAVIAAGRQVAQEHSGPIGNLNSALLDAERKLADAKRSRTKNMIAAMEYYDA